MQSEKHQDLSPRANTIRSVPCRFSVFFPSRLRHASRGETWRPRASTEHPLPCRFSVFLLTPEKTRCPRARTVQSVPCRSSQSPLCVSLNARANTIQSVPCRFSVFLPSCLLQASRGQTWRPRTSTDHSLLCRFSQSLVFLLTLEQTQPTLFPCGSVKVSHLE